MSPRIGMKIEKIFELPPPRKTLSGILSGPSPKRVTNSSPPIPHAFQKAKGRSLSSIKFQGSTRCFRGRAFGVQVVPWIHLQQVIQKWKFFVSLQWMISREICYCLGHQHLLVDMGCLRIKIHALNCGRILSINCCHESYPSSMRKHIDYRTNMIMSHTIHVWYIYLHLVVFNGKIWKNVGK